MRCDYPMGYDEDYLEPACEIFLQLFLQNAQIEANEDFIQENEGVVNAGLGGYESDDNFSLPSLHTISDASLSFGESSGDEGEAEAVTMAYENFVEIFTENSFNDEGSCECFNAEPVHSPQNSQSDRSLLTESNQNPENSNISNAGSQETDASAAVIPSNEPPISEESSLQTDTSPNNNNISSPSTYVSLFVVVPPTSFPNESDNLLSEVPSDRLLSDAKPVNSQSASLLGSDNRNIELENESLHTDNKICDNSQDLNLDNAAVCSSFSVTEEEMKSHSLEELHSESDIQTGVSSVSKPENIVLDDNHPEIPEKHPESVTLAADLSDEINMNEDENASCDGISDKSVPNLKRKVANSADEDLINKVPKYSVSHESNEPVSEESQENYSKELSGDELLTLSEEDNTDILPSTINAENVPLPLGRVAEENSVTEHQTDL